MTPDRLLAHYERIADAPDAVPRLRKFILDLAVRGKLAPQDPSDEPAAVLLERIEVERKLFSQPGGIETEKPAARGSTLHFDLPRGWIAATLKSVCLSVTDGDHLPPPKSEVGIPFLVIGNVRGQKIDFTGCRFVPETYFQSLALTRRPQVGDILYTLVGSYGIPVSVVDGRPFCVQRHIGILRPSTLIELRFLLRAMESDFIFRQAAACATGIAQKTVPLTGLRKITVPIPPFFEQRRIVAKVDELMALCDRLETARKEREAARDRASAAALARLGAPDADATAFARSADVAIENIAAITTRPDQIKRLRQTILNLAIRGRLLPQDPNDEPTAEAPKAASCPLEGLPHTWAHSRLADLLEEDTRNGYSRKPDGAADGTPILRISAGTVRADGVVAEEEHKLTSGITPELRSQYGLARGDLLACRFNGNKTFVGRLSIFHDYLRIQPVYPDKLIRVRVNVTLVSPEFLRWSSDSDVVRREVESHCATTVGNWGISATNLKEVRFPIPPLAEQLRIVSKVDELMALCNRLEASLVLGEDHRSRLLGALLAEALAPAARLSSMSVCG